MKKYVKSAADMTPDSKDLQHAIDLINEYLNYEFHDQYYDEYDDPESYDGEISANDDLHNVGLMYTTTEDGEHELQVSVDLINAEMLYYVDDKLVHKDRYNNTSDLSSKELQNLDWNDMYNRCESYI